MKAGQQFKRRANVSTKHFQPFYSVSLADFVRKLPLGILAAAQRRKKFPTALSLPLHVLIGTGFPQFPRF
jgi:hypothetical protein